MKKEFNQKDLLFFLKQHAERRGYSLSQLLYACTFNCVLESIDEQMEYLKNNQYYKKV